jgi:osmotically-inducible protein OsmY
MHMTALMQATARDAALLREVIDYLSGPAFPALQGISIEVSRGVVTFRGQVKSFHIKQVLVHACRRLPRVADVVDELRVAVG